MSIITVHKFINNPPKESKLDKLKRLDKQTLEDRNYCKSVQAMYQQLTPRLQSLVNAKILTDHSGGVTDGQPWEYHPEQIEYIRFYAELYNAAKEIGVLNDFLFLFHKLKSHSY